jgi:hypothetical protein
LPKFTKPTNNCPLFDITNAGALLNPKRARQLKKEDATFERRMLRIDEGFDFTHRAPPLIAASAVA